MSESVSRSSLRPRPTEETEPSVDRGGLELLSDDCAVEIISMVSAEPVAARRIAEELDVSRATVYRRLDRLEAAGLIEASVSYDPDGHHRQKFTAAIDRLTVTVGPDGVEVACDAAATDGGRTDH